MSVRPKCCAKCAEPLPEPAPQTVDQAAVKRAAYEDKRRGHRTENPNLSRDALAVMEGGQ